VAAPLSMRDVHPAAPGALRRHDAVTAAAVSSVAGAIAMLAVAMLGAAFQEISLAHPLRLIGESFVGPEALSGAPKIAFGALVHLATSLAFALLFIAIVPRDYGNASAMGVGVGFALFGLMFMMTVVVPWANPGFRSGMQEIGGTWVIAHAVFGVVLGATPAIRRSLAQVSRPATVAGAAVPPPRPAATRAS
jgi:hypothetical protein